MEEKKTTFLWEESHENNNFSQASCQRKLVIFSRLGKKRDNKIKKYKSHSTILFTVCSRRKVVFFSLGRASGIPAMPHGDIIGMNTQMPELYAHEQKL